MTPIKAWWFCKELTLPNGDGRQIAAGVTHTHEGLVLLCKSGLHSSRQILDALGYAPGPILCRTLCGGEIIEDGDKLVCSERSYLAIVDASEMLQKFARLCALDVIGKWDAPEVVVKYLKTGDDDLRTAARSAAWAAWVARSAAWSAAESAARSAARSAALAAEIAAETAARRKQNRRLRRMALELIRSQA